MAVVIYSSWEIANCVDFSKSDVGRGYCHFDMAAGPYCSKNTLHYGAETYLQLDMV